MKITIDGEVYMNGNDFFKELCCSQGIVDIWRCEGMPFAFAVDFGFSGEKSKYLYPVEKCHAWFRGEEIR